MTTTSVIYIVGKGRSGSTLLDSLLGQLDGVIAVGELWHLWDRSPPARACSCGRELTRCPIWRSVLDEIEAAGIRCDEVLALQRQVHAWSRLPLILAGVGKDARAARRYAKILSETYRAISRVTGDKVIVDSSKWPVDPPILRADGSLTVATVHLVRDPRAVAFSWTRTQEWGGTAEPVLMPRFRPATSATSWIVRNAVTEISGLLGTRYPNVRIRYEDLVDDPVGRVGDVTSTLRQQLPELEVNADGTIPIAGGHVVAGNPSRHARGRVKVQADEEWISAMSHRDKLTVTAVTAPLLARYGYRLRR